MVFLGAGTEAGSWVSSAASRAPPRRVLIDAERASLLILLAVGAAGLDANDAFDARLAPDDPTTQVTQTK